jgi:uncharacterized protein (DUF3820 family)
MPQSVDFAPDRLLKLVTVSMPFGKYEGRLIADLPGHSSLGSKNGFSSLMKCSNCFTGG